MPSGWRRVLSGRGVVVVVVVVVESLLLGVVSLLLGSWICEVEEGAARELRKASSSASACAWVVGGSWDVAGGAAPDGRPKMRAFCSSLKARFKVGVVVVGGSCCAGGAAGSSRGVCVPTS